MYIFLGFLLGYLVCYLELKGANWAGVAGGAAAIGLMLLRLVAGDLMRPYTKTIFRGFKTRIVLPGTYLEHHLARHETYGYAKCKLNGECSSNPTQTSASR